MDEFTLEPGIGEPLNRLEQAGWRLYVATNQPDIARGLLDFELLSDMNQRVLSELPIEAIEVCPHDDRDRCECRKPKPGMLIRISERTGIEIKKSFMIGDSWRDVAAARAVECAAIMLDREYNRAEDSDYRVFTLNDAARLILGLVT